MVTPNYSIDMLNEDISNIKKGECDFTKSVDWRPAAPLGILYIAGSLRKAGFDVQIFDLHRAYYLRREKNYFKKNNLSNFFEDHLKSILKTKQFDVLGISCLFNVSSTTAMEIGNICKRVSPSTRVVMGGHYPTNMYHEVLNSSSCDYVILGEAEKEFVWLISHFKDSSLDQKVLDNPHIVDSKCIGVPAKKPAFIKDLDSLAMPAWDVLPENKNYIEKSVHAGRVGFASKEKKVKSAPILTTRGCPMKCTFCAAHGVHGRTVRSHSIEYIMGHIDSLVDNYDINNLLIEDDMFNYSTKRAIEFCNKLYDKYQNRFTIEFPNGIAVWKLNEELIISLRKIGLKSITIAVESGSPYVQKEILKKNMNLSDVKKKVELLKKYEIGVRVFYIVGLIGETINMMNETVQYALDLNSDWSEVKIFTPLAGSEMYNIARGKGYLDNNTSEHVYNRSCLNTPDFSSEQVKDVQYDANIRINFLNNRFLKEEKYEKAEKTFRGLLNNFPNHLFAQWGLWQALEGQEKVGESNKALNKLLEMSETSAGNRRLLKKYQIHIPVEKKICC